MIIDEDLVFKPLAFNKWEVHAEGEELAIVTERYISKPVYVVLAKAYEKLFQTRDEVIDYLVELANGD